MLGIADAKDVSRVFDDHMLKSAARAEARNAVFSCVANRVERALHVLVRTARGDPEAEMVAENCLIDV